MRHFFRTKIYKRIFKLDRIIRIGLDRVLPRNLTVRYVAALIAVATLAVSGQLFIQSSLVRQTEDQKTIRTLEIQIHDSETLRKSLFVLQSTPKLELADAITTQFQKDKKALDSRGIVSESLQNLISNGKRLMQSFTQNRTRRFNSIVNTIVSELLKNETSYRSSLKELSKYYDQKLESQIYEIKRTEILLLLTTLLVLIIEALYVFRPGVEGLYGALRIRSDFLGRMGHEMRNPMNSILGMTHLLFETPLTEQQDKYLSILQKSSSGLLEVLNNLLDFSSIESGTLKMEKIPFDFYKLLERSIDLAVYGAHANGIELILDLDPQVPLRLNGDPVRLQQILSNLLGNAVKFTQKGEVVLKVQLSKQTEDEAFIQFSVIDTGMGIDRKKINKIFDAFVQEDSTVRRRFGGTGLGLSISRDLVELLGGALAVESQKGRGSRFYFTVPFPVLQKVSVKQKIHQNNFEPFKAIIAEPNDSITEALSSLIRESGGWTTQVSTDSGLTQYLDSFIQNPIRDEVFIIDYEFSRDILPTYFSRIRRGSFNSDSFIFLIKTTASSEDIEKLAEYGIKNFLFKPVKPLQLLEAIGQSLTVQAQQKSKLFQRVSNEKETYTPRLIHDSRPLRVLAADDSKDNQFLVKAYLESLPYRVTFADNGKIALEKFKVAHFDIVLMDLQMPEMDGYTAVEMIREWERMENLSTTPVIAVSAHDNETGSVRFQNSQFSSYLVKPISPNQLRQTILNFTQKVKYDETEVKLKPSVVDQVAIADLERELANLGPVYLQNRRQELEVLKQHLSGLEFEKIKSLAHRLKGNAKSYGFEDLGKIGAELEEAASNLNLEQTRALIAQTENYLNSTH